MAWNLDYHRWFHRVGGDEFPDGPVVEVTKGVTSAPMVISSPHSGRQYPSRFVAESRLDALTLRRSEDAYVDQLFASAPELGATLVSALFPRAYIDVNREPFELDPEMFVDELPPVANIASQRVRSGLGTIAKVVANGAEIYRRKLTFAEAQSRLDRCYWPYHRQLKASVDNTFALHQHVILLECHSMPSAVGPQDRDRARRPDFVFGDRFGSSCHPELVDVAENLLRSFGYHVARNHPYAGGFITSHYGRPHEGIHALQIEINRHLYLDENRIELTPHAPILALHLHEMMASLLELNEELLKEDRTDPMILAECAE